LLSTYSLLKVTSVGSITTILQKEADHTFPEDVLGLKIPTSLHKIAGNKTMAKIADIARESPSQADLHYMDDI